MLRQYHPYNRTKLTLYDLELTACFTKIRQIVGIEIVSIIAGAFGVRHLPEKRGCARCVPIDLFLCKLENSASHPHPLILTVTWCLRS